MEKVICYFLKPNGYVGIMWSICGIHGKLLKLLILIKKFYFYFFKIKDGLNDQSMVKFDA